MTFRRKYKFNWIDHLHYMGKGCWYRFTPLQALFWSFVGSPLLWLILLLSSSTIEATFYFACLIALAFGVEWLLNKYRLTPERERSYYRRYPKRMNHYNQKVLNGFNVMLFVSLYIWALVAHKMLK